MKKTNKISRQDIIREIARESKKDNPLTIAQVSYVVNTLFAKIVNYTNEDIPITVEYFGRFESVVKKPRRYKTPQGVTKYSKGHRTLSFKASDEIVKKFNKK